jgi:hypothetical protein
MLNNLIIGSFKSLAKSIVGHISTPLRKQTYNSIVDHALHQFLSPEEADQVINGFRRSEWSEDSLQRDIDKLNSEYHEVPKDEHYENAILHVKKMFTPDVPLYPVHFTDLRQYPWQLSTSVGAPYATDKKWQRYVAEKFEGYKNGFSESTFTKPYYRDLFAEAHKGQSLDPPMLDARMTKRNLYNELFYITRIYHHMIKDGKTHTESGKDLRFWHTAFARRHLVKTSEPDRVRLVFGAPFTGLTSELPFVWPIQAWLLSLGEKSPMLWGYETLTGGWHRLCSTFNRLIPQYGLVATIDWSGFDRFARHTIIKDIHARIFRPMFDFTKGYHPTREYPDSTTGSFDPQRVENLWNWMSDSITSTPLLMPNGDLIQFQHSGIFSGYFQTQLLDSTYNLVMIFTILSRLGFDLNKVIIKVQGDDSIFLLLCVFILTASWLLTMIKHYAKIYFGAVLSEDKSEVHPTLDDCEVLKYRNRGTMPYRDTIALLAQLRHPERADTLQALMARSIGIAYANCGSDPRVYQICEDIYLFLKKLDVEPNASGLPSGLRFIKDHQPGGDFTVPLDRFPSYFDTVRHLIDPTRPSLSEKYWPTSHFIGIPGQV